MTRFLLFLFLSFIWATFLVAAPPLPPVDENQQRIPWFTEQQLESPFITDTNFVDTTSTGFHRYDPFMRHSLFMAEKGNIGHAGFSMHFAPVLSSNFTLNPAPLFPGYLLNHEGIRFYRPEHVFTDLQLVIGDNREQFFIASHNQKLHETLYIGAQYQIVNSRGFYNRMGARNNYIRMHFDFQEPGKRYHALGSLSLNTINNQESGGLSNPDIFEEDPDQASMFFLNATSRHKENAVKLNHFYNLGFFLSDTAEQRRFFNLGRINHQFTYRRQSFVFNETVPPNTVFFETEPVIPGRTNDSTIVNTLENHLGWSNFPIKGEHGIFPVNFNVFIKHRIVEVYQPYLLMMLKYPDRGYSFIKDDFSQCMPGFIVESDPTRLISFRGTGLRTYGGYNDGDYDFGGSVKLGSLKHSHSLSFSGHYANKEAPYFLSNFMSNYVSWDNDFAKTQWQHAGLRYSNPYLTLGLNYYSVTNMVFMGPDALPVQNESTVNVVSAGLGSEIGIGIFRTTHNIIFQKADDDYFLNFPEFASRHSLYFDFSLFKKALGVQTGLDIYYNSGYPSMAYMPVVRQFYAQDNYPGKDTHMVDLFANFKISRTRIFVKMENLSSLVTDVPTVYLIPFYPIPQAAFKFGVSWMFFN